METATILNGTRYYIMAVTPTRLYSFTGVGSLETVFASYLDHVVHFMELPGEIPNSELHFYIKQRRAVHFAWLSGAGIYHGGLNFGAQHRISEQIIEELQFDQTPESVSRGVIGLCSDATAALFYAYDQKLCISGRDMWKVYLDMKEYDAALANFMTRFSETKLKLHLPPRIILEQHLSMQSHPDDM
ncbi:hypothetical protein CerSpe_052450 [Prunus speciosa]